MITGGATLLTIRAVLLFRYWFVRTPVSPHRVDVSEPQSSTITKTKLRQLRGLKSRSYDNDCCESTVLRIINHTVHDGITPSYNYQD